MRKKSPVFHFFSLFFDAFSARGHVVKKRAEKIYILTQFSDKSSRFLSKRSRIDEKSRQIRPNRGRFMALWGQDRQKSIHIEQEPVNIKPKPAGNGSKPIHFDPKSAGISPKSADIGPKSADIRSKSGDIGSKSDGIRSKSGDFDSKRIDIGPK
jgi:hypothetical protein